MRSASLLALAGLALAASQACGQCYYIAPPTAPDMKNPGYYFMNPYGVIYGPNHCVRPPYPPYQGVLPRCAGPMAQYANNPQQFQAAMQNYGQKGGFGGGTMPPPQFAGFAQHLWARSPRDFFMYDTDPAVSPYNYGYSGSGGVYGGVRGACD